MHPSKLYYLRDDEVQEEVPISRKKKNSLPLIHCILVWNEENEQHEIHLDDKGVEFFYQGVKCKINNRMVIKPRQNYVLKSGDFVSATKIGQKPFKIYIHYRSSRYIVIKRISDLPSKKVLLCIDTRSRGHKVILKLKREDSGHFERFIRSASLLSRTISNCVAQLRDVGTIEVDEKSYIFQCFEHFPGKPLSEDDLPLQIEQAAKVFQQVALGIQDLARAGLVHRSLTPEHILINEHNDVKLVGLSLLAKNQFNRLEGPLTLSGSSSSGERIENYVITRGCEIASGDLTYVPTYIVKSEKRDLYAVLALFIWSMQSPESAETCTHWLAETTPEELPTHLNKLLGENFPHKDNITHLFHKLTHSEEELRSKQVAHVFSQIRDSLVQDVIDSPFVKGEDLEIPGVQVEIYHQPLQEIASDFYDFVDMGKDRYGLLIGDGIRHDADKNLYTSLFYPIVQLFSEQKVASAELLEKMNLLLYKCGKSRQGRAFATALHGVICYNEYSPHFMYASAGHPPPILYRGGKASYLQVKDNIFLGTSLGISPEHFHCLENIVHLQKEDILLFYTDGIIEGRNAEGEGYQEKLLRKVEEVQESDLNLLIRELRGDLQKFSAESPFTTGDVTLIALKVS